ncbi:MAG: hypothetical protein K2Q22_08470, partial [Cytophagales bacterium]|nr:hypothetical protein [Cytophagales bacterium]
VYFYIGNKTNTGTEIEKAGLVGGKLYGVSVSGMFIEANTTPGVGNGFAFALADLGDVSAMTGAQLNTASDNKGVTKFLRPEDGDWDPNHPNDFYFNTTNSVNNPSRLWRLRFTDINNPELGGTATAVLDGTEGQQMLDNMTMDNYGNIILVEDVGNNAILGKVYQYNIASDKLKALGQHNPSLFTGGTTNPSFITQDEEASGPIDMENILGKGWFLVVDQIHNKVAGEQVEGGQILAFFNPDTYKANKGAVAGPSSSKDSYLLPLAPGVEFKSILTAGDVIGGYKLVGTPDGSGAFDNGNGTFTFLVNHEFNVTDGVVRAHGSKGALVSKWVIKNSDLSVVSGADLIQNVNLWNGSGYTTYNSLNPSTLAAFGRFCSGILPVPSAFLNTVSGLGTMERIFMNGEEIGSE